MRSTVEPRRPRAVPPPVPPVASPIPAVRRGYDPDALDRRDPRFISRVAPIAAWLANRWLRMDVDGERHIPHTPALFVANHNGGIMGPDLFCTVTALWRTLGPGAPLYALAHDFAMRQFTLLGRLLQKVGGIAASPTNARRVLAAGGSVLVYPGGDLDAYRLTRRRDEVVIVPRTGFVRVAREAGVPIVPVVAQGAHRSAWIFSEGRGIARAMGMPRWARLERFPLALALPWGFAPGPWLPYLPLPFRVRLRFLPPVPATAYAGEDALAAATRIQALMQHTMTELAHG